MNLEKLRELFVLSEPKILAHLHCIVFAAAPVDASADRLPTDELVAHPSSLTGGLRLARRGVQEDPSDALYII